MKQLLLCGCLFVLAGFLVSPVSGQMFVLPVGGFQNPLLLVESKDAQKDLKLTDEQIKKIAELSRQHAEQVKGLGFQKAEDREKAQRATEATKAALSELLAAEQAARLKQLELQQRGAMSFITPQISQDLAITQEQRTAIIKIVQANNLKMVAIVQAAKGNHQEIQTKMSELHRAQLADVVKGLSATQQTKWLVQSGEPFTGVFPMAPVQLVTVGNPRPQPVLKWHMNDLAAAQAEARETGKPIFVTFRCEA